MCMGSALIIARDNERAKRTLKTGRLSEDAHLERLELALTNGFYCIKEP